MKLKLNAFKVESALDYLITVESTKVFIFVINTTLTNPLAVEAYFIFLQVNHILSLWRMIWMTLLVNNQYSNTTFYYVLQQFTAARK